jgi:putative Mg2+ transporter-C (MgtC) family protein
MDWTMQMHIMGNIALAAILGGIIGIEREFSHKPAGLRTHMLVAGMSALIVVLGRIVVAELTLTANDITRADPTRIIHAVITGISILGAGTIIRSAQGESIHGLTTAASILFAGAIGIAIAMEEYFIGIGSTVIALIILMVFKYLEKFLGQAAS